MKPAHAFRRFFALPHSSRRELVCAAIFLPLLDTAIRLFGLQRTRRFLLEGHSAETADVQQARALAAIVNMAGQAFRYSRTCLARSVLLEWQLKRRGIAAQLRIGVRPQANGLSAHAWVECAGVVVNDRPDIADAFAPFRELEAAPLQ